jgi:regulatory protein
MAFPRSRKLHDVSQLYEYAVGAIARRMRTVAELKRLLRQKNIAGDREAAIDAVINKLKEHKYLNDTRYAEMYSTFRRENEKFGRRRVITDLKVKGVHSEIIGPSVDAAYAGVDEEKLAREYLVRKRIKQPTQARRSDIVALKKSQRETARVFRALLRAGFRSATIIRVLKQWHVDDELLSTLAEDDNTGESG